MTNRWSILDSTASLEDVTMESTFNIQKLTTHTAKIFRMSESPEVYLGGFFLIGPGRLVITHVMTLLVVQCPESQKFFSHDFLCSNFYLV